MSLDNIQNSDLSPGLSPSPGERGLRVHSAAAMILVATAAIVAGYAIWVNAHQEWPYDGEIIVLAGRGNNDIAGWKTYRNEEYGFEFKYPAIFMIGEGIQMGGSVGGEILSKALYASQLPYQTFFRVYPKDFCPEFETISEPDGAYKQRYTNLDNRKWLEITEGSIYSHAQLRTCHTYGYEFELSAINDEVYFENINSEPSDRPSSEALRIFKQILSTFKFIEPKRADTCIQVITPARNKVTGEIKDFPTPCDVPEGWEKVYI